jgi:DNA-binding XRE family transcriptional regulator
MQKLQYTQNGADVSHAAKTKENQGFALALAWLAQKHCPNNKRAEDRFGELINNCIWKQVPNGSRKGCLKEKEEDIRQDAYLLLHRYLRGNRDIAAAEEHGDLEKLQEHIEKCVRITVAIATRRMARKETRYEIACGRYAEEPLEYAIHHPALAVSPFEMGETGRRKLILAALDRATKEKAIRDEDAAMIRTRIEHDLSQAEFARLTGVSREAIHQREKRVLKSLRRVVRNMEFNPELA